MVDDDRILKLLWIILIVYALVFAMVQTLEIFGFGASKRTRCHPSKWFDFWCPSRWREGGQMQGGGRDGEVAGGEAGERGGRRVFSSPT